MTKWTPELSTRPGPRYAAIAEALADDVAAGRLAAGERLPPQRDLAYQLGVTVGTVSRAYTEAERRGLVSAQVGRGTYVRGGPATATETGGGFRFAVPERHDERTVELGLNCPAFKDGGGLLAATLGELAREPDLTPLTEYQPELGMPAHRAAGAAWMGEAGFEVTPERVVVTAGVQHGMLLALLAVARAGDGVATETLTYPGIKTLAAQLGLRLEGVAMDGGGLDPEAFAALCRRRPPKVLYLVPTQHNPTTATVSAERRRAIAEVARHHGVLIIEDDIHARLPDHRPPPIAAFAPERTFYLTGTAKALVGGLRVGWMAAPTEWVTPVGAAVRSTCWFAPPLMVEVAARWIADGTAGRLVAAGRNELRARHALARRLLPAEQPMAADPTGLHGWLPLTGPWRGLELMARLRERGVVTASAETFALADRPVAEGVRLSLCGVRTRASLERGLVVIADTLRHRPETGLSVV